MGRGSVPTAEPNGFGHVRAGSAQTIVEVAFPYRQRQCSHRRAKWLWTRGGRQLAGSLHVRLTSAGELLRAALLAATVEQPTRPSHVADAAAAADHGGGSV